MTKKEKDIVLILKTLRYKDNQYIVDIFSRNHGKTSLGFITSKNRKKDKKRILIRPPNWLEIEYVQSIKFYPKITSATPLFVYQSLFTDMRKSAIALFMTEILRNTVSAPDNNLFDFIKRTFWALDREAYFPDFHLHFLKNLTFFLGILPEEKENGIIFAFNKVVKLNKEERKILEKFLISGKTEKKYERQKLTKFWINYLTFHLDNFHPPESLKIYHQVFE